MSGLAASIIPPPTVLRKGNFCLYVSSSPVGSLVEILTSPFSTKIGYVRDKMLGGDLVPPG